MRPSHTCWWLPDPYGFDCNKLLTTRTQLSNLLSYMDGKSDAEKMLGEMLNNPELLKGLSAAPKPGDSEGEEKKEG